MKANACGRREVGAGGPPGRRREAGGSAGHREPLALARAGPAGHVSRVWGPRTRRGGRRDREEKPPRRCPRGSAMAQRQDSGGEDRGGSGTHWSFWMTDPLNQGLSTPGKPPRKGQGPSGGVMLSRLRLERAAQLLGRIQLSQGSKSMEESPSKCYD